MREIQQENRELRAALEDYHITLEHIMSKYREHTSKQIYKTGINFKAFQDYKYSEIIKQQAEKIQEMAAVMDKAAEIDETSELQREEIVSMLKAENQVWTICLIVLRYITLWFKLIYKYLIIFVMYLTIFTKFWIKTLYLF